MNGTKCALCKKPMGNSLSKFEHLFYVHAKCQRLFDCRNCLSMILQNIEGKCICGNTIQLNVDGDRYRILHKEQKNTFENLIILKFSNNPCYTTLEKYKKQEGLKINIEKGTWDYYEEWKNNKIGESRNRYGKIGAMKTNVGIIGVYDRTVLQHLENMKNDARNFTENSGDDD